MPKTTKEIHAQRERAFRHCMGAAVRLAAIAHPETGGNESLVRNWGNAQSKRAWNRAWSRWRAAEKIFDNAYALTEHARHDSSFRPIWCRHCQFDQRTLFDRQPAHAEGR